MENNKDNGKEGLVRCSICGKEYHPSMMAHRGPDMNICLKCSDDLRGTSGKRMHELLEKVSPDDGSGRAPWSPGMAVNLMQMICWFIGQWSDAEMGALPAELPTELMRAGNTFRTVKFNLGDGATPERLQEVLPIIYDVLYMTYGEDSELVVEVISEKAGCDFMYVPYWVVPDILKDMEVEAAADRFAGRLGYMRAVAALPDSREVITVLRESMRECGFVPKTQKPWGLDAIPRSLNAKQLAEVKKLSRVNVNSKNGLGCLLKCLKYVYGLQYPSPIYEIRAIYDPAADRAVVELCPILPAGTGKDRIKDVWDAYRKKTDTASILAAPVGDRPGTEIVLCGADARPFARKLRSADQIVRAYHSQNGESLKEIAPELPATGSPADAIPADGTALGGFSVREIIRELKHRGITFGNGEINIPAIYSMKFTFDEAVGDDAPSGTAPGVAPAGGNPMDSAPHDGTPLGDATVRDILRKLKLRGVTFGADGPSIQYVKTVSAAIPEI